MSRSDFSESPCICRMWMCWLMVEGALQRRNTSELRLYMLQVVMMAER